MVPADEIRPAKTKPEGRCPNTRAYSLVQPTLGQDESFALEVGRRRLLIACHHASSARQQQQQPTTTRSSDTF
jgi:hypothetical protein